MFFGFGLEHTVVETVSMYSSNGYQVRVKPCVSIFDILNTDQREYRRGKVIAADIFLLLDFSGNAAGEDY